MEKISVHLSVAREDVAFILEPAAKAMLAEGKTPAQVTDVLMESAKRVLRISLSDAGEKLSVGERDIEAALSMKTLMNDIAKKARKAA
jgi:hypothetical protein